MRISRRLYGLLALGLIAATITTALAQGPQPPTPAPNGSAGEGRPENATQHQEAARERVAALAGARQAILSGFAANRSAILAEYQASLDATRATFLAERATVLQECDETRSQFTNASETQTAPDHAKCVSDGLAPLADEARAANSAARELASSKLQAERAKGLQGWAQTLRAENDRYQARTGQAPGGA